MSALVTHQNFSLENTPSLHGKVCVITGGQDGIGKEITAQLLLHGIFKIYVLGRSTEKFNRARQFWQKSHALKEEDLQRRVEFLACDLSDMTVVKAVADELFAKLERLDILINNAGLMNVKDYTLSPQGIETIWATNVMGHFVLTQILLTKLEETATKYGSARIVITSSSLHILCQELKYDLTMSPTRVKRPNGLDSWWRYGRSKLGLVLFTKELTRRLNKKGATKVYANVFNPGNIPTDGMDTWKDILGSAGGAAVKGIFGVIGQSESQGAATAIYLAASPEVEERQQKGMYFVPIATEDKTSKIAADRDLARNLWYWCDDKATKALGKGWEESLIEEKQIV